MGELVCECQFLAGFVVPPALRRRGVGGIGGEGWIPGGGLQFTSQLDWRAAKAVLHLTLSC